MDERTLKQIVEASMSRRSVLRAGLLGGAAMLGAPLLAACSNEPGGEGSTTTSGPNTSGADTLNVFSWSSYHDMPWIKEYEDDRGVTVNVQNVGSVQDMFSKVRADPGAFDLALATAGWIENYVDADLLIPVDESRVPNLTNVNGDFPWRDATTYQDENFAIIYNWGNQPLCYLNDQVEGEPASWADLYDPAYADGRVSLVDDPTTQLPFIGLMLGFEDPYDMSESEFEEWRNKLFELQGAVNHVSASIDDQTQDFANGSVYIGVLYNISTWSSLTNDGLGFTQKIATEGSPTWSDNYVITKQSGANKLDLAYDFINFTLSVPWQARFIAASANNGVLSNELAESQEAQDAGLDQAALDATLIPMTVEPDFYSRLSLLRRVPNLEEWLNTWNEFKLGLG